MAKNEIQMQYVNRKGEIVSADSPDVAYQVNPNDSEKANLVKALKEADGNAPAKESKPVGLPEDDAATVAAKAKAKK